MVELPEKFVIRNSDRQHFKKCRQSWDFGSKLRGGHQSVSSAEPLEFGSAIHAGMEAIYNPEWLNSPLVVVEAEAHQRFLTYMKGWRKRLHEHDLYKGTAMETRWPELIELGRGMLTRYIDWAEQEDHDWELVHTEIEFEVPIPIRNRKLQEQINENPKYFSVVGNTAWFALETVDGVDNCLVVTVETITSSAGEHDSSWNAEYIHIPVYHQGRIDNLMRFKPTGKIWVWDHKTEKDVKYSYEWLELDTQGGTYLWAIKEVLGVDAEGVMFNYLVKDIPKPPKILKSGKVSKDKSQRTTKELLIEAVEYNLECNPFDYKEFIDNFEEPTYFHREEVLRSSDDLDSIGVAIAQEAMDMIGNPYIYTNPSQFACGYCAFKGPCRVVQDGGDPAYLFDGNASFAQNLFEEKV